MSPLDADGAEPARDCPLCPRLVAYRHDLQADEPDWFNAPVPSFGDPNARLLVVGLAPGRTGANRTGRPFTGDYAGIILYPALLRHGFGEGEFDERPDDGMTLTDCLITNAVRCVPPQNKPVGAEINACRDYLVETIAALPRLKTILVLGRIAHESTLRALGQKPTASKFAHGATGKFDGPNGEITLVSSYHCSRYNVNTNRLTDRMFDQVVALAKSTLF